jgi:hypothetical protein
MTNNNVTTKDVMDLLLLTQYFDAIRDIGSASTCRTTFVPSSVSSLGGSSNASDMLRNALLQAGADPTTGH